MYTRGVKQNPSAPHLYSVRHFVLDGRGLRFRGAQRSDDEPPAEHTIQHRGRRHLVAVQGHNCSRAPRRWDHSPRELSPVLQRAPTVSSGPAPARSLLTARCVLWRCAALQRAQEERRLKEKTGCFSCFRCASLQLPLASHHEHAADPIPRIVQRRDSGAALTGAVAVTVTVTVRRSRSQPRSRNQRRPQRSRKRSR